METSPGGAAPVKSESRRSSTSCSQAQASATVSVKAEKPVPTGCEVMDTNSNNNNEFSERKTSAAADQVMSQPRTTPLRGASSSSTRRGPVHNDPLLTNSATASRQSDRRTSSGRVCSFGPSPMYGLTSPSDFPSICGTPTSISQLLNLPSSAFSLDGLEFPSPLGSGHISPLASARLGRKRTLSSISPLSTSSLDLNNLIRTSPTSLVNYITTSRTSSAGSMGHLSPSLFINPALFQPPYTRPLFTLRNAAHPHVSSTGLQYSGEHMETLNTRSATGETQLVKVKTEGEEEEEESSQEKIRGSAFDRAQPSFHQLVETSESESEGGEGSVTSGPASIINAPTLETVCEEGAISEDEGMHTDPAGYSSAITENESELESKPLLHGMLESKPQRVYYSYPSVEEPHNNQCRWEDCDRKCNSLDDLVRHVNTDHIYRDSRKDFVCQWSGCVRQKRAFKAQYMLLVHMRRHTGEKPHKCTYEDCNKAYSRLENLKTHLRSHTGERPYVCKYEGCGKAFSNASDCAKHMNRTHSDEKPYACPNPGCTKRYTDPSSRRKHMKNCLGNKKARTDDRDPMSGADEESCAETSSTKSSTSSRKTSKARKSERKRPTPFGSCTPSAIGSDPGYASCGSQGYVSGGYNSSGYETEEMMYQQSLSDPLDPNQGAMTYPPSFPSLSNHGPPASHVTNYVTPNGKASRQKGGGLIMPAGRNVNPATMTVPQQLLRQHHHHTTYQFPQQQQSSHFSPQLPPPPTFPSSQSSQSGLSRFQSHLPPPGPPLPMDQPHPRQHLLPSGSTIPAPHLPPAMTTNNENSPPMGTHHHHPSANEYLLSQMSRNPRGTASSGYSSFRGLSPGKVFGGSSRRSPSDDGSSVSSSIPGYGGTSLRGSIQSNSYSTFSESTSSRLSSPSSNSGRSDSLRLQPHPPPSPMTPFMMPKPPSSVGSRAIAGGDSNFPLKRSVHVPSDRAGVNYARRLSDDAHSERSWCSYSSHSSRHSYCGSELSDDLLEKLPSGTRKNSFAKIQPLPLPESMGGQFSQEMPDEGMDFGSSGGQGELSYLNEPSPMQTGVCDIRNPTLAAGAAHPHGTLPLHHYDTHSQEFPSQVIAHGGLYDQFLSSETTYNSEYNDKLRAMSPNMVVGDMASFASTLPEETQFFENLLSSKVK